MYSLAVADMNNDGVVEIIFTDNNADQMGVFFLNGYQSQSDIVVANNAAGNIKILFNCPLI